MSELKAKATTLWTQLVDAMRKDGLITPHITQSGPNTTQVIVEACRAKEHQGPWLSADMKPTPGREVVAIDSEGHLVGVSWSAELDCWLSAHDGFGYPRDVVKWCFVEKPE